MNIRDVLYMRNTGKLRPRASIQDKLLARKLGGGGVITTATGNPVSIITNKAQNAISTILSYSPKQSGSGDPSPQNIRPIVPWTEASLTGAGKNLFDVDSMDSVSISESGTRYGNAFRVNGGDWCISGSYSGSAYIYARLLHNGSYGQAYNVQAGAQSTARAVTITASDGDILIIYDATQNDSLSTAKIKLANVQVEKSSTATDYEPYTQGSNITVPLGGTYYGFSIDVERGVLRATHAIYDLGDLNWSYNSGALRFDCTNSGVLNAKIVSGAEVPNAKCEQYLPVKYNTNYSATGPDNVIFFDRALLRVRDKRFTDAPTFKTAVSGVMLAYELETPIELPLTPQTVALLAGNNTIWTDGDEVSVTYKAKK